MKIVFNKLQTSKEKIQVSLDGGTTWNSYVVSEIIESGIQLDENQEYDKIHIKGSATVLKNLDVVKSIEIPESITTTDDIFTYDLEKSTNFPNFINSITLPECVTSIGKYAFYDCSSLTSIDLPESLTSIGSWTFYGCTNLKTINFKGTKDQWNAIKKYSNWDIGCPSGMVINFDYQGE